MIAGGRIAWAPKLRAHWQGCQTAAELSGPQRVIAAALQRSDAYAADLAFKALASSADRSADDAPAKTNTPPVSTLLLKPVGDKCNLGCPYCYEEDRRFSVSTGRLDLNRTQRLLDNVLPHVRKPFNLFIHGGEPLLAGKEYFEGIAELISRHPHGSQVSLGVQTNAVLLDRDWASLFRGYGFSVGVSLDGPAPVHDAQRHGKHGEATYQQVMAGIGHLRDAGVEFGVTSVITAAHAQRENAAAELFDHFISLGIKRFDTHPAYAPIGASRNWNLSPALYSGFMSELFDRWLEAGDPSVEIRSIEEFFRAMTGFEAQTCFRSQSCTSIIGVDPSGLSVSCTRPFSAQYDFGNLIDMPLPAIQEGAGYRAFVEHEANGRAATAGCEWTHLCGHGGCPHERLEAGMQAVYGRHVYCTCAESGDQEGYPAIFRHFTGRVEQAFDGRENG